MRRLSIRRRTTMAVLAALVLVVATATPASATVHPYSVTLIRGRVRLGLTYDVPASPFPPCPNATTLAGNIDDVAFTDNITATLSIQSPDVPAPIIPPATTPFTTGRFVVIATGSATGTNAGTFFPAFNTFTGLTFPGISFAIRSINTTTCALGGVVCSGAATLTLSGGLQAGVTLPLTTGEQLYAGSTAGSILSTSGCGFPWGLLITPGSAASMGANPSVVPPDPGAVFRA